MKEPKTKQEVMAAANKIRKQLGRLYSTGISYTWKQYQEDMRLLDIAIDNDIKRIEGDQCHNYA